MLQPVKSKLITEDIKNGNVTLRHVYRNGVYEASIIYVTGWRAGSYKTKAAAEKAFQRHVGV